MCFLRSSRAAGATQRLQSWEGAGYFQHCLSPACGPSSPQPHAPRLTSSLLSISTPSSHLQGATSCQVYLVPSSLANQLGHSLHPCLWTLQVLQGRELFHRTLCHCRTSPTILGTLLTHLMSSHTGKVPVESHITGLDSHHVKQGPAHSQRKGCAAAGAGRQWSRAGALALASLIPIPFVKQPGQGGRKGMQSSPALHFPIDS